MLIYLDRRTGREAPLSSDDAAGIVQRVDGYHHVAGSEGAVRADSEAYGEFFRGLPGIRLDAVTSELPGFAMSLTARRKQIVEERTRKLNAARLFRAYTEIPVGARKFTIPFAINIGEAVLYKGSHQIPSVHRAGQEDEFKTAMIVTSYSITDMQQAENAFAQANMGMVLNTEAALSMTCTKVLLDYANQLYWFGDSNAGLYGLVTYPALPKITSDIAFDGTDSPTDVADELNAAIQYPSTASGSTFNANLVVMSERVASYLSRTRMGSIDMTTILEFVKKCNPGVRFEIARELKDLNGNTGYDGILVCNDDIEHTCIGIQQGVTFHPPERIGLSTRVIVSMSVGGAGLMPIPGANVLLEVAAPTY